MKTHITDIPYTSYNLIKIFFEANDLFNDGICLNITDLEEPLNYKVGDNSYTIQTVKKVLSYSYDEENINAVNKITFMALKHLGFTNMLHDYLNKCASYSSHPL